MFYYYIRIINLELYYKYTTPSSAFMSKPHNLSIFLYTLAPQNSDPPATIATMDHRHCIDFSLPLHRHSIQPIIFYIGKLFWGN